MTLDQNDSLNWVELRIKIIFSDAEAFEDADSLGNNTKTPLDQLLAKEKLLLLERIAKSELPPVHYAAYSMLLSGEAISFCDAANKNGLSKMAISRMVQKLAKKLAEAQDC